MEAVAYGEAYPVPVYGHGENILRIQRSEYKFPYLQPDEQTYVEHVASLTGRKKEIRAEAREMRDRIEENQQFLERRLCSMNNLIDSRKHSPREIPIVKMIDTNDCRALAEIDQSDIGEKIDNLFPFIGSIPHHFGAVLKGYQTYGTAIELLLNRIKMGLYRRIAP